MNEQINQCIFCSAAVSGIVRALFERRQLRRAQFTSKHTHDSWAYLWNMTDIRTAEAILLIGSILVHSLCICRYCSERKLHNAVEHDWCNWLMSEFVAARIWLCSAACLRAFKFICEEGKIKHKLSVNWIHEVNGILKTMLVAETQGSRSTLLSASRKEYRFPIQIRMTDDGWLRFKGNILCSIVHEKPALWCLWSLKKSRKSLCGAAVAATTITQMRIANSLWRKYFWLNMTLHPANMTCKCLLRTAFCTQTHRKLGTFFHFCPMNFELNASRDTMSSYVVWLQMCHGRVFQRQLWLSFSLPQTPSHWI